jgi:tight adherence protein B
VNELIPILGVFAAVAAGVYFIFALLRGIADAARNRKGRGDDDVSLLAPPEPPPPKSLPQKIDRGFERLVIETGWNIGVGQALGAMALSAALLGGLAFLIRDDFALTALGVLAGVTIPLAVFAFRRIQYRWKVQEQLPDAFFLLARSLRAGLNAEQSMATVASYGTQPIAGEFKRVVDQTELGLSVPAALHGMARRLNLADFNTLVTAMTLHRTVGGNLATLCDRVATSARDRNQFRGYFRAATALARITGFAIAAAPILLVIGYAIWQPDFIERFTSSSTGLRMLGLAAILEVVGIIWMISLLRTDY